MPTSPSETPISAEDRVADAPAGNWVDRFAPKPVRPYMRLARADRPIGTWLLLFPCLWSQALAHIASGGKAFDIWYAVLFAIGAFVMRGAGCAYNDYVDRDYDAKVARTRSRPIPSGQVKPWQALALVVALGFTGLAVLVQFNGFTIALAIASLALVLAYPFMKRLTYWPQLVLGLTFNWGALVGWAAVMGSLDTPALLLYAGAVAWTIGYDTIYAHQDRRDDAIIGVRSTARLFDQNTRAWLAALYAGAIVLFGLAIWLAGGGILAFVGLGGAAVHAAWQVATFDAADGARCLMQFRANRLFGWILFAGLVADSLVG